MDEYYYHRGLIFVWDYDKAISNIADHDGITFQYAADAFFDPFLVYLDASRNDEQREGIIGRVDHSLLFVVNIENDSSGHIRIISARYATPNEKRYYESRNT